MLISIIIVNYYNETLIIHCLKTLVDFHPYLPMEVIIVNNGGELENVKKEFSNKISLEILEIKENKGFSYANNQGIKAANGDFILFLNPDTYFIEPVFFSCIEKIKSDKTIGVLGCKLLNKDGSLQLSYHDGHQAFKKLLYRNPIYIKFFKGSEKAKQDIEKIKKLHLKDHIAPWLSGAFLLFRKSDILKNNWFWDEDFFMYWEDVELCFRVRKSKYSVYYFSKVGLVHIGGGGIDVAQNRFKDLYSNKLLFILKLYGKIYFLIYIIFTRINHMLEEFIFFIKKDTKFIKEIEKNKLEKKYIKLFLKYLNKQLV